LSADFDRGYGRDEENITSSQAQVGGLAQHQDFPSVQMSSFIAKKLDICAEIQLNKGIRDRNRDNPAFLTNSEVAIAKTYF
jgi:hypothetical protein